MSLLDAMNTACGDKALLDDLDISEEAFSRSIARKVLKRVVDENFWPNALVRETFGSVLFCCYYPCPGILVLTCPMTSQPTLRG